MIVAGSDRLEAFVGGEAGDHKRGEGIGPPPAHRRVQHQAGNRAAESHEHKHVSVASARKCW